MRTKLASLAAVGLLALAAAVVPAAPGSADGPECNLTSHCYGIVTYNTGSIDATGLELWTDCLHLDTPSSDMALHVMWLWTNAAPPTTTWIEAGYIRGIIGGGDTQQYFRWYWAEYTGSTYYSHFIQWASVAQWNNMTYARQANNKWGIYLGGLGGTKVGETAQTATAGTQVQVGAETTEPKVYSHGKSRYLLWRGVGAPYWTVASPGAPSATSSVYSVSQSGNAMEQTSLQNMCSPAPLAAKAQPKATAPTMRDLKAVASRVAEAHGEKSLADVQVVATTRKAAQRAIGGGDKLDSDQASYLVQMKGSFVGPAPKGATLPRGSAMTLTIDSTTGEVTDWSLGKAADLAKLGSVKKI